MKSVAFKQRSFFYNLKAGAHNKNIVESSNRI